MNQDDDMTMKSVNNCKGHLHNDEEGCYLKRVVRRLFSRVRG